MNVVKKLSLSLLGMMFLLILGCSSQSTSAQEDVGPPYEPRSFDEVNPENVDLALVPAPSLPQFPDCTGEPRNVRFTLETKEYEAEIAPGITYTFLSFNGAVPGPAIVVCLGDWVEVTLKNSPSSKHAHNIDFHAATGELGGGSVSIAGPGQQTTIRFFLDKRGRKSE